MKRITYFLTLVILIYSCNQFRAGSYPYVEKYEFNIASDTLIKALTALKNADSSLKVPGNEDLTDHYSGHWYHLYFWNTENREIYYCWVRELTPGSSTLAFVAVNSGTQLGNWRGINKDFDKSENEEKKVIFERFILTRLPFKYH